MGKNRDRLSIIADILETTNLASTKTRIMFSANLSFKLLEKYLDVVLGAHFVRVEGSKYFLTEPGREFLKRYKRFYKRYAKVRGLLETLSTEHDELTQLCAKHNLPSSVSLLSEKE